MTVFLAEMLRSRLSPDNRLVARAVLDQMFSVFGTTRGAKRKSSSVAFTFDDGPDSLVTPKILNLLRERGIRCTFFMLSDNATRCPALVKRVIDEGHEVGLHCDRHDRLNRLGFREIRRRLTEARNVLEQLCDNSVTFFRPPYGAQSLISFLAARSLGLEVVAWGPYAEDWISRTPESAAARVLGCIKSGDIVLFHDGLALEDGTTAPDLDRVRVVELVLDGLHAHALAVTTVGRLLSDHGTRRTAWFRP